MIKLEFDNREQTADLVRTDGGTLEEDEGFSTAVLLSLFTDARSGESRGWWGDSYAEQPGDVTGSKLWTLSRAVGTAEDKRKARDLILEALNWMINDGIAGKIEAEIVGWTPGVLAFTVAIYKPGEAAVLWSAHWEAHFNV